MQNTDQAPAGSAAPAPSSSAGAKPATPDGFVKVDAAPQMQSGEALLVEAYAFIWVVIFGLVLMTWLRQRGLDVRMNELEASIALARTNGPGGGRPASTGGAVPKPSPKAAKLEGAEAEKDG